MKFNKFALLALFSLGFTALISNDNDDGGYDAEIASIFNDRLMEAADRADLDEMKTLLQDNADINFVDNLGYTPLMKFIDGGDIQIGVDLLGHGSGQGGNVERIGDKYLEGIKFLVGQDADVNAKANDGTTPLSHASRKNYPKVVEFLLSKGAEPNETDRLGVSPLMIASDSPYNKSPEIVKFLINAGADPEYSVRGDSPLRRAVLSDRPNSPAKARLLLAAGAVPRAGMDTTRPELESLLSSLPTVHEGEEEAEIVQLVE